MNASVELTTDRLLLKGITPAILKELFATMNEAEIISYFDADEQSLDRMTKMVTQGMETYNISLFYFLICDKNTGTVLGECGFHTWNTNHHRAD
ncbi:MAG: N-acetyltransferase, partial [Chitinophagaceae bacterium]